MLAKLSTDLHGRGGSRSHMRAANAGGPLGAGRKPLIGRDVHARMSHELRRAAGARQQPTGSGESGGMDDLSVDMAVGKVLGSFPGVTDWNIEGPHDDDGKKFWAVHIDHAQGHSVAHVYEDGHVYEGGGAGDVPVSGVKPATPPAPAPAAPSAPAYSAPSHVKTGRGPTGKLRNFKAMGDVKFKQTFFSVYDENNDPEALAALTDEWQSRYGTKGPAGYAMPSAAAPAEVPVQPKPVLTKKPAEDILGTAEQADKYIADMQSVEAPPYPDLYSGMGMQQMLFEKALKPGHKVDVRWTSSGSAYAGHGTVTKVLKATAQVKLDHPIKSGYGDVEYYPAGQVIKVPLLSNMGTLNTGYSANNGVFPHGSTSGLEVSPGYTPEAAAYEKGGPSVLDKPPAPEVPGSMVGEPSPLKHGYDPNDYEHTGDFNVPSHMEPGTIYLGSDHVHYQHMGTEWGGKGGKVKGYTAKNLKTGTEKFVPYFAVHGHEYEIHQPKGSGPVKTPAQATSSADQVFADLMKSVSGQHLAAEDVDSIAGKNIVVTGKIPGYSRDEVHAKIKAAGGTPHGSIGNDTHILVTGDKVGATKINAAAKKGVKVMSWADFEHLVEAGLVPSDEDRLLRAKLDLLDAETTDREVRLRARVALLEARIVRHGGSLVLVERNYSHEERMAMAASGQALPDGSFPIKDKEDLGNALSLLHHAKDKAKARAHIKRRAAALGAKALVSKSEAAIAV